MNGSKYILNRKVQVAKAVEQGFSTSTYFVLFGDSEEVKVQWWWDPISKNWITQLMDVEGHQVGSSNTSGGREGAEWFASELISRGAVGARQFVGA